jgi:hypothetical protein
MAAHPTTNKERQGGHYWCVRLTTRERVWFHADELVVGPAGELIGQTASVPGFKEPTFLVAPGAWATAYPADVLKGGAVSVEYWEHPDPKSPFPWLEGRRCRRGCEKRRRKDTP